MPVCACVFLSVSLSFSFPPTPSSVSCASIPALLTPKMQRSPCYKKFCWFLGSAASLGAYPPNLGGTGLPPHTGMGGASRKEHVLAEVSDTSLPVSLSSSWVRRQRVDRPPFPRASEWTCATQVSTWSQPLWALVFLFYKMGIIVPASQDPARNRCVNRFNTGGKCRSTQQIMSSG